MAIVILLSVGLASVLASLIPAFVVKILMSLLFRRVASYLVIFLIMAMVIAISTMTWSVLVTTGADVDTLPVWLAPGLSIVTFAAQTILLSFFATDEDEQNIAMWKWAMVLLLQYVVYVIIALIIALIMTSAGVEAQGALNFTRLV